MSNKRRRPASSGGTRGENQPPEYRGAPDRTAPYAPERGAGQRPLRVGAAIRQALSEIMLRGDLRDPVLQDSLLTVTEVSVSRDLRNAIAFIVPFGGRDAAPILAALRRASPWLRGEVARRLGLRYAPMLDFRRDASFETAERIEALLRAPAKQPKDGPNGDADKN
jgi:ribosome-binding factor A